VGRVTISLSACKPNRLPYKPDLKEDLAHYYPKIHKLLEFQNAKSLSKKTHAPVRADNLGGKDYCFWAIKLYTEDLIRQFGEGTPVPTHLVEDWSYTQFSDHKKGISTVRAKCRSVWHWNDKRDWVLPKDKRKWKMTRRERALTNAENAAKRSNKLILDATSGLMATYYKKKSGSWHIEKIAQATNLSSKTVSKYLKELKI
jgi:predicted transcriptional regulator